MAVMRPMGTSAGADLRIARRATALRADGGADTRPLDKWREADAYVLLGDPGAGKSESLRAEACASGGVYKAARDFIALGIGAADAGKTLFIDGLDEMRAGTPDGRVSLDSIRTKLNELSRPRFRLSCREHDWRAQTDLAALNQIAPGGVVQELHLEPLSLDEQQQILQARHTEVPDVRKFLERADEHGLAALFGNPLLLDLSIRAVANQGDWPESRRSIYELACRELATERSPAHLEAKPTQPGDVDRLIDDAGLLCALLLLSGRASITRANDAASSSISWHTLPAELPLHDPAGALASKVFATAQSESAPRHRSIAEYLAAQAIARRLQRGLPLGRVLALMQGGDGGVVEPLRGLLGWLAVHDVEARPRLINLDPLAVVLNGDVAAFSSDDKRALLEALRDAARLNPWFRNGQWVSYPFAPLASPEMAPALAEVLRNHSPDDSNQALIECVLDALNHGQRIPELRALLEGWVEDASAQFRNRLGALLAWKRCTAVDAVKGREWLDALQQGLVADLDARLAGNLLFDLYPQHVHANEVLSYWPAEGSVSSNTILPQFWSLGLIEKSEPTDFAVLADAWLRFTPPKHARHHDSQWSNLSSAILANALEQSGNGIDDERLHSWLRIGTDTHGFSRVDRDFGARIAEWLTDRPERLKSVIALGWRATPSKGETGRRHFWETEQLLHGARLPHDWLYWLLQQAAEAPNDDLAQYGFSWVARAVVDPPSGFAVPTIEQVEGWVEENTNRWPRAPEWLQNQWSSSTEDNWQSEDHRRSRKQEAEALANRDARRNALAPYYEVILSGTAPAGVMHQLAGAHEERFYDIRGATPEQRVQEFLVADEGTASSAIANLVRVLERDDLPSADEVLTLDEKGKYHLLRPVALLAARLAYDRAPRVVDDWPEPLLATLVACWLTDGTGNMPDWYKRAAEYRPRVLAPLIVRHALRRFRRKGPLSVNGLWALSHDPGHAALARLALKPLLEGFPQRASESARRALNRSLLAALHVLEQSAAAALVRGKVDHPSVDAAQRICWLVADLSYRSDAAQRLVEAVGTSQRRLVVLGMALNEQSSVKRSLKALDALGLSRLIQLLAPITRPERPEGAHWVSPAHERGDTVRALIDMLAGDPRPQAAAEMSRLLGLPSLGSWREYLLYSVLSQEAVSREAYYVHPNPRAAALTLANSAPANRADLTALTLDHLHDIEHHLRGSDTSGIRLFWKRTASGELAPIDENECRDLLLEKLRTRLAPLKVHVVPERQSANQKRADLRIEFTASDELLAIPVEIKKENNYSLWLAWRDQLQALYVTDPAADGHGIYLVLWFAHTPRPSPEGNKPSSAADLERRLIDRIPDKERARLAVRAMDLSAA